MCSKCEESTNNIDGSLVFCNETLGMSLWNYCQTTSTHTSQIYIIRMPDFQDNIIQMKLASLHSSGKPSTHPTQGLAVFSHGFHPTDRISTQLNCILHTMFILCSSQNNVLILLITKWSVFSVNIHNQNNVQKAAKSLNVKSIEEAISGREIIASAFH